MALLCSKALVRVCVAVNDEDITNTNMGSYTLTLGGMRGTFQADLPLVEGVGHTESGQQEPIIRALPGDEVEPVNGFVFCIALCYNTDGRMLAIALGRSGRVAGAYERLGIMDFKSMFYTDGEEQIEFIAEEWFADAERAAVKIV